MRAKRTILTSLAILIAGLLALSWSLWGGRLRPLDLRISSGAAGGTYVLFGERLAQTLEDKEGIGAVEVIRSRGTLENIERILAGEADLALAMGPVLTGHPRRDEVRVLMSLYTDRLQVVARKSAAIGSLRELEAVTEKRRVFLGPRDSGTRLVATAVLEALEISEGEYELVEADNFREAAAGLQKEGPEAIDVAFFVSSLPAAAVAEALASGCCELLDVKGPRLSAAVPGLSPREIPAGTYENQARQVSTLGGQALLVGRPESELPAAVVAEVIDAVFDNLGAFAEARVFRAQDVRIEEAFDVAAGLTLHRGAEEFRRRDANRLLIASGSLNGKYYEVGKRIETLLRLNGIPARVIHTDGSFENLGELAEGAGGSKPRPFLAIVQYDAALTSFWGAPLHEAGELERPAVPEVKSLRRIATLHREVLHTLARREILPPDAGQRPTLSLLEEARTALGRRARVAVGAKGSGTRSLAEALLDNHQVESVDRFPLATLDTVEKLNSGEIDVGFMVSHMPSEALKSVIHDRSFRLLSIEPRFAADLLSPALDLARIEPEIYGAQIAGEPAVETLGTWAVLVARSDLRCPRRLRSLFAGNRLGCDVKQITRAVFEGAAFLGINTDPEKLAHDLSSLPLHRRAETYYRQVGHLPSKRVNWLATFGNLMGILVVLAGGYRGLLAARRDATRRRLSRTILDVPLSPAYPDSATDLMRLRREVRRRAHLSVWRAGQLDSGIAAELEQQILSRIEEAKERLKQALLVGIRALGHAEALDRSAVARHYDSLEENVWSHFERNELDPDQHRLLLAAIREGRQALAERR